MTVFLGIDGGGTKTEYCLLDGDGRVAGRGRGGSAYYPEVGVAALATRLADGIRDVLASAGLGATDIAHAVVGLPAFGEDSALQPTLESLCAEVLPRAVTTTVNDAVCGWAGALAARDGINVVAGTGSIAYGVWGSATARAGGWGEGFGDEGSAYWIAREGLALFARMADGRAPRGPLYDAVRHRFGLADDLDLCARVYGPPALPRSEFADLARCVTALAADGDPETGAILDRAAEELVGLCAAVRHQLRLPEEALVEVSCSGGLLSTDGVLRDRFERALVRTGLPYSFVEPFMSPSAGAAAYAARLAGRPLAPAALDRARSGEVAAGDGSETRSP